MQRRSFVTDSRDWKIAEEAIAALSLPQQPGERQELLRRADEFAKVGAVVPIDMVTTSKMARLIADGAAPPTDKTLGG
jgi:hypothetical protein